MLKLPFLLWNISSSEPSPKKYPPYNLILNVLETQKIHYVKYLERPQVLLLCIDTGTEHLCSSASVRLCTDICRP